MNVSFYLLPKSEVTYLKHEDNIGKALRMMRKQGFQTIPLLNKDGQYAGVISEGDFLWTLINDYQGDMEKLRSDSVDKIKRRKKYKAVSVDADITELDEYIINQNFVPIVDGRNIFIGIITRKTVIQALMKKREEYMRHMQEVHHESDRWIKISY